MATDTGKYRKYCEVCKEDKHWTEYEGTGDAENDYGTTCKVCRQKSADQKEAEIDITQRDRNLESLLLARNRSSAKDKNLAFDITTDDIQVPEKCPYLGTELIRDAKRTTHDFVNVVSLDRIDSSKGYIKGNVEVISLKAKEMKARATPTQLLDFAIGIMQRYKR